MVDACCRASGEQRRGKGAASARCATLRRARFAAEASPPSCWLRLQIRHVSAVQLRWLIEVIDALRWIQRAMSRTRPHLESRKAPRVHYVVALKPHTTTHNAHEPRPASRRT